LSNDTANTSSNKPTGDSIRVLVVEDHHVVRQGLVALLNVVDGLEVVGEAADGVEAITQFRKHKPDVTLMDLRLPRMGGVDVIQRIRVETPHARFVVLTTYDGDEDIYKALKAGARAYLLKGMTTDELVATIRTVLADALDQERTRTGGLSEPRLGLRFAVHNRAGQPCPRCGQPLLRVSYESYEIVYCKHCQTRGRALADRRLSRLLR